MPLSPQSYDLCLAADVAADLGVVSDDRVQRAVSAASRAIADYCVRTFEKSSAVVEYPNSSGRPLLSLRRPPIVSITSITEQGATVAASDYESVGDNVDAGLVLRKFCNWMSTKRIDRTSVSDIAEGSYGQTNLIAVTYAGGYVTPGQNALDSITYPTVTLPDVVREAAMQTSIGILRLRGVDPNVQSEAIGDWSISFFDSKTEEQVIPAYARALLAPYKLGWAL